MAEILHPSVAPINPSTSVEPLTLADSVQEQDDSRLQSLRNFVHAAVAMASNMFMGTMYTSEDVKNHLTHNRHTVQLTAHHTKTVAQEWRDLSWTDTDKYKKPAVGSVAWLNLVFGESIALYAQGFTQGGGASHVASFGANLAVAAAVEAVFTAPVAWSNRGQTEPVDGHRIARAAGSAFWLGGAWGAQEQKLAPKHAWIPVASYMTFAVGLAAAGEVGELAEKVSHSPAFLPALITLGVIRQINGIFEYKGPLDKISEKTADVAVHVTDRLNAATTQPKPPKRAPKHAAVKSKRTAA